MFTPTKFVVFLVAALSVAAMPSHMGRNPHNHREIAARVAHPVAARDMAVPAMRVVRKRGSDKGKCPPGNTDVPKPTSQNDPPATTPPYNPEPTNTPKENPETTNTPDQYGEPTTTPKEDPQPTTTPKEDPKPTTTPKEDPKPTTTPPQSTPTSNPDNGNGQTYTGQGTFYATGLGACGITNNDGQDIAAVSQLFYDTFPGYTSGGNPNLNPLCGKTAKVTYQGKTILVKLTDRCVGCARGDLDFSPHAFNQLADPAVGRISGITWQIID